MTTRNTISKYTCRWANVFETLWICAVYCTLCSLKNLSTGMSLCLEAMMREVCIITTRGSKSTVWVPRHRAHCTNRSVSKRLVYCLTDCHNGHHFVLSCRALQHIFHDKLLLLWNLSRCHWTKLSWIVKRSNDGRKECDIKITAVIQKVRKDSIQGNRGLHKTQVNLYLNFVNIVVTR